MSEESLKQAFGSIWGRFLEFEITRSKLICELAGNPVHALILQVVAYHNRHQFKPLLKAKIIVKSVQNGKE